MSERATAEVTGLLHSWCRGDRAALGQLIPLVHDELRRRAHSYMLREPDGHLLQTTALVNEAYVRLIDARGVQWQDRAHFFAISATTMRRILVDFARARDSRKRQAILLSVAGDAGLDEVSTAQPGADLVALDDALQSLAAFDDRGARVVELRFFGGLSVEESAEVLGVSPRTVKRDWTAARAWLLGELQPGGAG
ncbi:MAG TPA: sigma-70 family RNA polymerase sigma factor [Steroidobacteraceae bacterium]|nr:sigma-70 family RNA polymerase sigma factor [Steroidobacteraceae bacterium]